MIMRRMKLKVFLAIFGLYFTLPVQAPSNDDEIAAMPVHALAVPLAVTNPCAAAESFPASAAANQASTPVIQSVVAAYTVVAKSSSQYEIR